MTKFLNVVKSKINAIPQASHNSILFSIFGLINIWMSIALNSTALLGFLPIFVAFTIIAWGEGEK